MCKDFGELSSPYEPCKGLWQGYGLFFNVSLECVILLKCFFSGSTWECTILLLVHSKLSCKLHSSSTKLIDWWKSIWTRCSQGRRKVSVIEVVCITNSCFSPYEYCSGSILQKQSGYHEDHPGVPSQPTTSWSLHYSTILPRFLDLKQEERQVSRYELLKRYRFLEEASPATTNTLLPKLDAAGAMHFNQLN